MDHEQMGDPGPSLAQPPLSSEEGQSGRDCNIAVKMKLELH